MKSVDFPNSNKENTRSSSFPVLKCNIDESEITKEHLIEGCKVVIKEELDNKSLKVLDINSELSQKRDNVAEHSEIARGIRLMYCHFITFGLTLIVEEKRHQTRYVGPIVYLSRFVIGVWKPTSLIFYIFSFYPDDCPFQDENSGLSSLRVGKNDASNCQL